MRDPDPFIYTSREAFLQRVADYVRLGYAHCATGLVPAARAAALHRKFARLYGVEQTRHQRAWCKSKGQACSVLMMWLPAAGALRPSAAAEGPPADGPLPSADQLPSASMHWVLLVTAGEGLAHELERLRDVREPAGRLVIDDWELVTLPRPGSPRPAWTWRVTRMAYEGWRARVIDVARRRPEATEALMRQLYDQPGFAGVRRQVGAVVALLRAELRRAGRLDCYRPRRLLYVQRLRSRGVTLQSLLRSA